MTPKEKADNLVAKFCKWSRAENDLSPKQSAKYCALIAVNEIINSRPNYPYNESGDPFSDISDESTEFWQKVKEEINKK